MTVKVSDVMRHVRNHFVLDARTADWTLASGALSPDEGFAPGMWVAIAAPGPAGVYQLDENGCISDLADASWTGSVYQLNPPADFIRLCGDIGCWAAANPDPGVSSERLGEYSVSRKAVTWGEAFAPALQPYRRMFPEVQI